MRPAKVRDVTSAVGTIDARLNTVDISTNGSRARGVLAEIRGRVRRWTYRQAVDIRATGIRTGRERTGRWLGENPRQHFAIEMHSPANVVIVVVALAILVDDLVASPRVELDRDAGFGAVFRRAAVAQGRINSTLTSGKIIAGRFK